MTTYWKSLRLGDPGVDSFRSPSEAGQHPHTVPSSEEIQNSQHMFQFREGFRPSPNTPALTTPPLEVGAVKETPTQPLTFFNFVSEHPFLTFGLGALAVYGISKMKEKDPSVNYPPRSLKSVPTEKFSGGPGTGIVSDLLPVLFINLLRKIVKKSMWAPTM